MPKTNSNNIALLREYNKQSIQSLVTNVESERDKKTLESLAKLQNSAINTQKKLAQMIQDTSNEFENSGGKDLRRSILVEKVSKEIYDNLLFINSENELVKDIKQELSQQQNKNYLFKYQAIDKSIQIYEESPQGLQELLSEEKEAILKALWDITLEKVQDTMQNTLQNISLNRKVEMSIKRTSGSNNSYSGISSSKSSGIFSSSSVSSTSDAQAVQGTHSTGDTVNVSSEALLRTEAFHTAMSTSEIRQQKIQAIKDKISAGNYVIDTKKLAFNLLREEAGLFS